MAAKSDIVIELVLLALQQLERYATLIRVTRAEGRDPTDEELAALKTDDDADRAALVASIERRRAEG